MITKQHEPLINAVTQVFLQCLGHLSGTDFSGITADLSFLQELGTAPRPRVLCAASPPQEAAGVAARPLESQGCIVGLGGAGIDYLAEVAAYPAPDDKIRTTTLQVS